MPVTYSSQYRKMVLDSVIESGTASVRVVSFERFVHDSAYRDESLTEVTVHLGEPRATRRCCDPKCSAQNTGIWCHSADQEAVQHVTRALPEYLVE